MRTSEDILQRHRKFCIGMTIFFALGAALALFEHNSLTYCMLVVCAVGIWLVWASYRAAKELDG